MYWLVETEEQIEYLINRQYRDAFIEIIPFHKDVHPALNDVSLVYFKPSIEHKGFMLCITHSECLGVSKTRVNELLTQIDTLWVRDKKSALFYFQIKTLLDSSILFPPYIQEQTQAHNVIYQKYPNKMDINKWRSVAVKKEDYLLNFHQHILLKLLKKKLHQILS